MTAADVWSVTEMRKARMKRKFQAGETNAERCQGMRARESHGRIADGTFVRCLQPTGQRVNVEQRIARVFMCSHVGAQRGCPRRGSECIKIHRNVYISHFSAFWAATTDWLWWGLNGNSLLVLLKDNEPSKLNGEDYRDNLPLYCDCHVVPEPQISNKSPKQRPNQVKVVGVGAR